MQLDLREILPQPGASLPFRFSMDLSDVEQTGVQLVPQPISVSGEVHNMAGALELRCQMSGELNLVCDRCLKIYSKKQEVTYQVLLGADLESEDDDNIVPLEGDGFLDLDPLLRDEFLLSLDTRNLCSEDCKGLCPRCGANLNNGP